MDRLTSIDASFLAQEKDGSHMHIGAVMVFEGPAPSHDEFTEHISERLHLVPRYRQKLSFPRMQMGRPLWIDDPSFNLDYHVRYTALPKPGGIEQLKLLTGRIFSQRLDRTKPLWEIWLIEGLKKGRFALINKTHHSLVDGVSGVDITTVLFDLDKTPAEVPEARARVDARAPSPPTPTSSRAGSRTSSRRRSASRSGPSRPRPSPSRPPASSRRDGRGRRRDALGHGRRARPSARSTARSGPTAGSPGSTPTWAS